MRVAPVVFVVLLAGCFAPEPDPAPLPPGEEAAHPVSLALGPGGRLGAAEAPADFPLAWGWRQWLDGVAPPAWTGEPAAAPYLVTNATATVVYVANAPVAGTERRPELTVWWGVDRSFVHHAFLDGPNALAPGEAFEAVFDLRVPVGGLVVPAGARPVLAVGTYYTDDAATGAVSVRLGDPAAVTRLDLVVRPLALAPAVGEATRASGDLVGGRCLSLDEATERDMARIPFDVPAHAAGVRVVLDRAGGAGPGDLDFALLDPAGEVVARGQGPGPHEEVLLREPNLRAATPGAWTLVVYNCTPQASTFEASLDVLRRGSPEP